MTDESLFAAALELPARERAAYLDAHCPDPAVRRQVEGLLAAAEASNPLDRRPVDVEQTIHRTQQPPEPSASVGDRIGPYKLLEKIGEGGMGEVWVADQLEPIKRRVALKLIKPGMDSRSVLGRFEAERQALAVMDHPNIAKVLDAGTTPDGRPYFVMELVKGTPITEFADARKLTPKQRLELFVPVCQAIQHAHMKGIIHRDIKPSNVLVALHDEVPVPKVIDFGVAKAVGQQLTEKTIYTGFGALVGTPTYMAPEQATFNQLDVDTRADVYALGVLLYELLAGSPPIERDRLKKAALDEMLRIVREEEPPRPSQRLSTSQAKASIAATRGSEAAKLSALMKGELDWIVMKALEKDRTRRYDTANGFAADVQRYLHGEQVQAVPPSVGYRLKKAYRRNKPAVWVATAFALLMTVGIAVATVLAVRASDAERQAVEERNTAEMERETALQAQAQAQAERQRADEEKRAAEAVREFLQDDLLRQADLMRQADALPLAGGGGEIKPNPTISELLDRAATQLTPERIEQKLPAMPFVQAEVLHAVAHGYSGVFQDAKALELIDRAIPLYLAARGPDDRATLNARFTRATLLMYLRRGPDAEGAFAAVVADLTRAFGPKDRLTFEAELTQALCFLQTGRSAEAVTLLRRLGPIGRECFGSDRLTMLATGYLPYAYRLNRQPALALREIEAFRASMGDVKAVLRPDHPLFAAAMGELSETYKELGRADEAMQVCREVIDIWAKKGDAYNANTWTARHQLAWRYHDKKDYPAAAREFADCLKAADLPFKKGLALDSLRWIAQRQGKLDEALDYARQALAVVTTSRLMDGRGWLAGKYRVRVGQVLVLQKKHAEAEPFLTDGYRVLVDRYDLRSPDDAGLLQETARSITDVYTALGKPDEAKRWIAIRLPLLEKDVRRFEGQAAESRESLEAVNTLAHAYAAAGQTEPLVALFDKTLTRLKAKGCPPDDRSVVLTGEIGRALRVAGRPDLNRQMAAAVYEHFASRLDVPKDVMARASFNLGHNLTIDKRPTDGVPHLRESLRLYREIDPNGWLATFSKIWLGTALLWDGKYDEAERILLDAHAEAVERRSKAPDWQKNYPETTAGRLASLYEATKKPDEAAKWKALSEKK